MSGHMGKLLYCLCLTRRRGLHIVRDHFFSKSHLSLIPSLLLSKCDPLRWARIWCLDADLEVAASILFTLDKQSRPDFMIWAVFSMIFPPIP